MKYYENKEEKLNINSFYEDLKIWESSIIHLMDIRHKLIKNDENLNKYIVPSNAYLYISGGEAEVVLDNNSFKVDRFGIFHIRKGTSLSVYSKSDWIEYYMILYKYEERAKSRGNLGPFNKQFGFAPNNPIFYNLQFSRMYEAWISLNPLELFYTKAELYKLIYQIYEDLLSNNTEVFSPDIISKVREYIEEHFDEPISIQKLADSFNISIGQLNRLFNKEFKCSPQSYLKEVRLESAKSYLENKNITFREIANATGFYDEFYMSKEFKKRYGKSPSEFRINNTCGLEKTSMDNDYQIYYTDIDMKYIDGKYQEGELLMLKQFKSKAFIATALSLIFLLTGCGSSDKAENESLTNKEGDTRIVKTLNGDVEVPANPKRVVVDYLMGDVVALGVTPIGIGSVFEGSAFDDEIKDATIIEKWEPEEIMALNPDLIITVVDKNIDKLSKIAPTVHVPFTQMSTEERVTLIGDVLNKQNEAGNLMKEYRSKVEKAKASLKEQGILDKTITIFFGDPKDVLVAGDRWGRGGDIIYNDLGFKAPEVVQKEIVGGEQYRNLSLEVIPEYVGDYMVYDWDPKLFDEVEIWKSIPAYVNEKTVPLDFELFYYNDIYSQDKQLDFIVNRLIEISK